MFYVFRSTLNMELDYPQSYIEVNIIQFSGSSMYTHTSVFCVFGCDTVNNRPRAVLSSSRYFGVRVFTQRLISRWWTWTRYLGFSTTRCRAHVPQPLGCEAK